jgi:hypothetical protein
MAFYLGDVIHVQKNISDGRKDCGIPKVEERRMKKIKTIVTINLA